MDIADDPVDSQRRAKVKDAMRHAWSSYEKYAWGHDEFQPQTKNGVDSFGGLGATLIDSLDTLYIMGLDEQFQRAREWVANSLDFNKNYDASVFETTIRVVGGLLSAYDLSGDKLFLDKAQDIADRLLPAWNTPTGIPYNIINLSHGNPHNHRWTALMAYSASEQLEFIALSQRTGDPKYQQKAENVILEISRTFPDDGLLPVHIDPAGEPVVYSTITFGAMGDSFYEYLLKVWIQGYRTAAVGHYSPKRLEIFIILPFDIRINIRQPANIGYAALVIGGSFIIESISLVVAIQAVRKGAAAEGMTVRDYIWRGHDPTAVAVMAEDGAAVTGLAIAAASLVAVNATGNPIYDPICSIIVSNLLGMVAIFLIQRNRHALIGRAIDDHDMDRVLQFLKNDPVVDSIYDCKNEVIGPGFFRFKAEIDFNGVVLVQNYLERAGREEWAKQFREASEQKDDAALPKLMSCYGEEVVTALGSEVDGLEKEIQEIVPGIRHVDIEAHNPIGPSP
ncbi:hypothetical protein K7X08_004541 [Anisodus acutangulus]|uniref:alpha-1,2-Mannosidase n=1 Tax=Anisodus acutangulus TaxID=402998 RepID=A0A9Q1RIM2_9SOLA|nr:hypothetical protein K7X08_004541 [Anisodus acutangulus]